MMVCIASADEPDKRPEPPRIPLPRNGMSSDALADYVGAFIEHAQARITGPGREQYDRSGGQRFERLTLAELLTEIQHEVLDIANYAVMFYILISRLEQVVAEVDRRSGEITAE